MTSCCACGGEVVVPEDISSVQAAGLSGNFCSFKCVLDGLWALQEASLIKSVTDLGLQVLPIPKPKRVARPRSRGRPKRECRAEVKVEVTKEHHPVVHHDGDRMPLCQDTYCHDCIDRNAEVSVMVRGRWMPLCYLCAEKGESDDVVVVFPQSHTPERVSMATR